MHLSTDSSTVEPARGCPSSPAECVEISPKMTTLLGCGPSMARLLPSEPVALVFAIAAGAPATLRIDTRPEMAVIEASTRETFQIVLLVQRGEVVRIGGRGLIESNQACFHLPSALRTITMALREPPTPLEARTTYRLAKSIELLCETIHLFGESELVAVSPECGLSMADSRRLLAARQMIDERWHEKLTLDSIARACGLNRAKLTRGFREMFDCTIAEALAARRLLEASRLLLTTDLPVSSIGYESGYLNNASFSRAFGRHFGRSPSHYRAYGMAA